jgi:hypothetical protein
MYYHKVIYKHIRSHFFINRMLESLLRIVLYFNLKKKKTREVNTEREKGHLQAQNDSMKRNMYRRKRKGAKRLNEYVKIMN